MGLIPARNGAQQAPRVLLRRCVEDLLDAGLLDHLAVLHHQHLVGHEAHHREVVADEDVGQAELVLQVLQQVEHLRLHRDVERAHRLVEHQHLGLQRQAARDRDALALAAGELVRVLAEAPRRRGRPCASSARARCSRSAASPPMPWIVIGSTSVWPIVKRGFSDAYGFWNTIWMRRRIGSRSLSRQREQVAAVEQHLAADRAAARLVQAQQRQAHRRLARARLADHAERVAARAAGSSRRCTALNSRGRTRPCASRSSWSARAPRCTTGACGSFGLALPRGAARRRCGRRSPSGARRAAPASAGRRAAPGCRRPAARRRCAPPAPARAPCPGASRPRGRRSRRPRRGRG